MSVRVKNFVRKKGSECREVRECVSRNQRSSVEKSRRKGEQSERCEKENSVSNVVRNKNSVNIVIPYLILINQSYLFNSKQPPFI